MNELIKHCQSAIRTVPTDSKPSHSGGVVFRCTEISKVRHDRPGVRCWDDSLWMFGERQYAAPDGTVSFRSVSVRIENFSYYVYFDACGMDTATVQSVVDVLDQAARKFDSAPPAVSRWDMVRRRHMIGVDYDQYDSNGDGSPNMRLMKPYCRLYLRNPSVLYDMRRVCEAGPIVDGRNRRWNVILYHANWDWGNMFMHSNDIRLQEWLCMHNTSLTAIPAQQRQTHCREEYVYRHAPGNVRAYHDADGMPLLCATIRTRVASSESVTSGREHAAVASPESADADNLVALCSDVYWSGHDTSLVRVRLFVGSDDGNSSDDDDTGGVTFRHACASGAKMVKIWLMLMNMMDPGAFVTLHDNGNDLLHVLLRAEHCNISRFRSLSVRVRPSNRPGRYYYSVPGRSLVNLADYMAKMQINPKFDAFSLIAAYDHPKMYYGPLYDSFSTHRPNGAAFHSGARNVLECGVEASIIRHSEQGPNIIADASALSRVCTLSMTRIISNGQQMRVMSRLRHDAHRAAMIINDERLNRPVLELPSREYNSFPDPPELPSTSLRQRDAGFDQLWADAVRDNPPHPRLRIIRARDAPAPESLPPTVPLGLQCSAGGSAGSGTKKRKVNRWGPRKDLFGRPVTGQPRIDKSKAPKPQRKKYGGGLVQEPQQEFYDDVREITGTLDFASMYPSAIQAEGYCYSNLVWDQRIIGDPRYTKKYVEVYDGDSVAFVTHIDGQPLSTLLPETERELVAERKRVKALMKQANKLCDRYKVELGLPDETSINDARGMMGGSADESIDRLFRVMVEAVNYDKQQLGSKLTQNALFGFTGVEKNGIMPCVVIMAAITATGRWMIRMCKWYAIRYYKAAVVYGDTDSVMIQVPGVQVPDGPEEGRTLRYTRAYWDIFCRIADEMGALFPKPHVMESECLNWPFLLTDKKKNYAYLMWETPEQPKKIKISGMSIKRDRCEWVRTIGTTCVKFLIDHHEEKIQPYLEDQLQRLSSNAVPLDDLTVSCSLKEQSAYKGDTDNLIQLRIAKKIETRTGRRPDAGSRITYIVVRGSGRPLYERGEPLQYVKEHSMQADLLHYLQQLKPVIELVLIHHMRVVPVTHMLDACRRNIMRWYAQVGGRSMLKYKHVAPKREYIFDIGELQVDASTDEDDDTDYERMVG